MQPTPSSAVQRIVRCTQRTKRRAKRKDVLQAPLPAAPPSVLVAKEDFYPDYPEDWIDVTEESSNDYLLPTHGTNVASRTSYALGEASGSVLQFAPTNIKQVVLAIRDLSTEMHEHAHTVHSIKDLVLAQNHDVHVLALKKLVQCKNIVADIFPDDVRAFARYYFKQKKNLLFINSRYPLSQWLLHKRPCMMKMPQRYQHEILFRAHNAIRHQAIGKVMARIQEQQTWPGSHCSVGQYVSQCLT